MVSVMVIKLSSISKFSVIMLLLLQLSYGKLILGLAGIETSSGKTATTMALTLLFVILAFAGLSKRIRKSLSHYLILETLVVLIAAISASVIGIMSNGLTVNAAIKTIYNYFYVILAIPLLCLLKTETWKFRDFLKMLVVLTMGSYLIRVYVSFNWHVTGNVITGIALESAKVNWIRNGILRINPPCLSLIFIPIAFYLFDTERRRTKKLLWLISVGASILYTLILHQSRAVLIYQAITIILMLSFKKSKSRTQFYRVIATVVAVVIIVNTNYFNSLMDSFTVTGTYAVSTTSRIYAVRGFGRVFLKNIITGIGFIPTENQTSMLGGFLADIGILGGVYCMGILGIIVYCLILFRGFYISVKIRDRYSVLSNLVFGMTSLVIGNGINIDCFYSVYAFAVPFYLAIIEYIYWLSRTEGFEEKNLWM